MHSGSSTYRLWLSALDWNVAVYKGLFLELPSGHVIVSTVYTFLSTLYIYFELAALGAYISAKKDG